MMQTATLTGRSPMGTTLTATVRWERVPFRCPECSQPVVDRPGPDDPPCRIRSGSWGDLEPLPIRCGTCTLDLTPIWEEVD